MYRGKFQKDSPGVIEDMDPTVELEKQACCAGRALVLSVESVADVALRQRPA